MLQWFWTKIVEKKLIWGYRLKREENVMIK